MAGYDWNLFVQFRPSDTPVTILQSTPNISGGTLADTDGAGVGDFTLDENLQINASGFSFPYKGTIDIDGISFVVVQVNSSPVTYNGYANVADPTATAATLPVGRDIDTEFGNLDTNTFTTCFAPGTLIATPEGETTVEALQIGDLILTADGRRIPVKWIGRQTVLAAFARERARPVRIAAGALGNGLPHTDLILTADHALILDGLAINAGALVNGTTITLDPAPERATYYHVETEDHDVILANGAPAETFVDYVGRQAFDNHAEYVALYGAAHIIAETPLPRIVSARMVPPAIRTRLNRPAVA